MGVFDAIVRIFTHIMMDLIIAVYIGLLVVSGILFVASLLFPEDDRENRR